MTEITQLGYVGLSVSAVERWERFATAVLGMEVSGRGEDGTVFLRMDDYAYRIALHPGADDDLAYAGWLVQGPAELERVRGRLDAAGIAVVEGSREDLEARKVRRLFRFEDPAGHRHEVFFGPKVIVGRPFRPGRPMTGFKAGQLGLGHLVMRVKDVKAAERFYLDIMGFRLTDYGSGRLVFMHCNPRHHSLAVGEVPGTKRLVHIMIEVQSIDDVGTAFDLCEREGIRLLKTIGRHPNDRMISFYLETPSGFELEYGYGAREVDDRTWEVHSYDRGDVWGHRPLNGEG